MTQAREGRGNEGPLERLRVDAWVVEEAPEPLEEMQEVALGRGHTSLLRMGTWIGARQLG